ncbi:carbohydrate esterase family 5 protein [Xylaria bambusicola]|uniref:carbohydrate esterase family 5 protein n=1 Tax=Xylaria bambusicola TaxID=326684 RepID=UPI0020088BB1|nr:carbohydrate esterase family 5 protein [Xylaria bambusicola]KAI0528302.1 carbohydrate esterase family 5 protein [Xylaria bambusicola]
MMRPTVLSLGLATMAAAAPFAVPLNETRAAAVTCVSGLYMIAARGSNEDPGEGPLVQITDAVKTLVPGSASIAVDYPAAIYDDGTYPVSVYRGIDDTIEKIQDYVAACGASSRIVLLGYSQGGNVMTDTLAGGVLKPDPITEDYRSYIKAVVTFGDPTFTAGVSPIDVGTATKNGIFSRGGDSLELLRTYSSVLRMFCLDHDTFCATGSSLDVHYSEVPTFAQAATDFIVSMA